MTVIITVIALRQVEKGSVAYTSGPRSVLGLLIEGSDPEVWATLGVGHSSQCET